MIKIILRMMTVSCLLATAHAVPQPADYVEGEVLVTFKSSVKLDAAKLSLKAHQLQLTKHFANVSARRGKHSGLIRSKNRTTAALLAELKNDLSVDLVEPNFIRRPYGGLPNDPLFGQLWGLRNTGQAVNGFSGTSGSDINFSAAWRMARTTTNEIVVAVIDSGVDYNHPDLADSMWTNRVEIPGNGIDEDGNGLVDDYFGYDFADGDSNPTAGGLHGTHVAGTIAATGKNQLGVIGVDYQARIMALKVENNAVPNSFPDDAIVSAIDYTIMMKLRGVNVVAINASFGGPDYGESMRAAIAAAGDVGIVFCAAAGNGSSDNDLIPAYPASYRLTNMIVVAATDPNDALTGFSNYGTNTVDIGAPGINIFSTTPTNVAGTTAFVTRDSSNFVANALTYSGFTTGITGTLYDCGLGYAADFPPEVNGNIALISRGTLLFSEKVANAMAAGALAAVIYNNSSGNFSGTLSYFADWIPAVSLSRADGLALKAAALATNITVANFLDSTKIYQFLQGTSMATPHVVGAVAFAAMNFPAENVTERIQRVLGNVDVVPALEGKVRTGGRLNLLRMVDTDQNGLPDWWENIYTGQPLGSDPAADPDHDGASNLVEWLSGTDPLNATSAFRIVSAEQIGDDFLVEWTTVGGHSYILQTPTNTLGNFGTKFVDVSSEIVVSGTGEGATNYLHLGGGTNAAAYYRVRQF
ncbi:MAG: S8 family serine peptidase [Verrucomicrobiota bacterium]